MRGKAAHFRCTSAQIAYAAGFIVLGATVALGARLVASSPGQHVSLWCAIAGIAPLFLAIRLMRPSLAAALAGFWGLCLVSYPSEPSRSGAFDGLATAFAIGLPALHAWLCAMVTRRIRFCPLFLAFTWIGVELAFVPLGFDRGLIGSFLDGGPVVGWLTSTLGTVFVGLMVATFGAWLSFAISEAHRFGQHAVRSIRVSVELLQYTLCYEQVVSLSPFAIRLAFPRGPPWAIA